MGAGQIGGIATLLDLDFNNAAGFIGTSSGVTEAQYVVYYLSHAMLFCVGTLIEAHVVLTAASCIYTEKYKFPVFGGTHKFHEYVGTHRNVEHISVHRGYNHSMRWSECSVDNVALLLLDSQFQLNTREPDTEYVLSRLRYGVLNKQSPTLNRNCRYHGWGSRRNGYLVPLLLQLRRVDVHILEKEKCHQMWNYGGKYLCLQQFPCKDDVGTVLECSGFLRGMMTSRLIDRPCGTGFLDMANYLKFLTCGVDDSDDIAGHNDYMEFEFERATVHLRQPHIVTVATPQDEETSPVDPYDPGPPRQLTSEEQRQMEENLDQAAADLETLQKDDEIHSPKGNVHPPDDTLK